MGYRLDFIFESCLFLKFINKLVFSGKKVQIEKYVYDVCKIIKLQLSISFIFLFFEILESLRPLIEVKTTNLFKRNKNERKSPILLREERQYKLALNWFIFSINVNTNKKIKDCFYTESLSVIDKSSSIFLELHKYEQINKQINLLIY